MLCTPTVRGQLVDFTKSTAPTIRVGDESVAACRGTVEVPVFLKNRALIDGVNLTLDFDATILGYAWYNSLAPEWVVERAVPYGQERVIFHLKRLRQSPVAPDGGDNPAADPSREILLLNAVFYVRTGCTPDSPFVLRSTISLGALDTLGAGSDSYAFVGKTAATQHVLATAVQPGTVSVYMQSGLEVGWGAMTRTAQEFSLPLYLTSIDPAPRTFLVGVDYDELFLNVIGVTGRGPTVQSETVDSLRTDGRGHAFLRIRLNPEFTGSSCHLRVADLKLRYSGGEPAKEELKIEARLLRSGSTDNIEELLALLQNDDGIGGAYGETLPGVVKLLPAYFVRGNADSSRASAAGGGPGRYAPDIADAQAILRSIFVGGDPIPCLEAADLDDDGAVRINDVIYLLNYFYRGGEPPAPPYPDAGPAPQASDLGCGQTVPYFEPISRS